VLRAAAPWFRHGPRTHRSLIYKGIRVDAGYRADIIVDERVLVELKCIERLAPIHTTQVITYLRLTGLHVGLLMNFNVAFLRDGIVRVVL
jgi:GxxExxY protein